MIARFLKDESGVTAIEYGLIAAFIGLTIIAAGPAINTALSGIWTDVQGGLETP